MSLGRNLMMHLRRVVLTPGCEHIIHTHIHAHTQRTLTHSLTHTHAIYIHAHTCIHTLEFLVHKRGARDDDEEQPILAKASFVFDPLIRHVLWLEFELQSEDLVMKPSVISL